MIATEDEKVFWVFDLVGQEQANRFQTLLASIDVVPQEQVIGVGRKPAILKQPQQVKVLSMDVT